MIPHNQYKSQVPFTSQFCIHHRLESCAISDKTHFSACDDDQVRVQQDGEGKGRSHRNTPIKCMAAGRGQEEHVGENRGKPRLNALHLFALKPSTLQCIKKQDD